MQHAAIMDESATTSLLIFHLTSPESFWLYFSTKTYFTFQIKENLQSKFEMSVVQCDICDRVFDNHWNPAVNENCLRQHMQVKSLPYNHSGHHP